MEKSESIKENLEVYNALKQPPKEALRTIQGGRLSGKTDINPQWRYKAMTEEFGMCGDGWKYEIVRVFSEPASEGQVFAFAEIKLYIRREVDKTGEIEIWSDPIPGYGGSMLVEKEKAGLYANDEGYKMAITDALSTSMKMLGVAGDVYAGLWDGAKYTDTREETKDTGGHWCAIHKTPFFKRGKMKTYAHPIKDEFGEETGEWCNEGKAEPAQESKEAPTEAGVELGIEPETEAKNPVIGGKIQNVTELKGLMAKHKIATREVYEILSIKSFMDLVDLDQAWADIKAAKKIEP